MIFSEFNSNCTLPPTITNWVSQPNSRGTLDILWTCITTLFLCTWSVQHPNVTSLELGHGLKSKLRFLVKKLKMMLVTLMVPEFLLLKAIGDNATADTLKMQIGWRAERDKVRWSKVHSFFADMGGFVVEFSDEMRHGNMESIGSGKETTSVEVEEVTPSGGTSSSEMILACEVNSTTSTPPSILQEAQDCEKALPDITATSPKAPVEEVQPKGARLTPHQTKLLHLITVREKGLPESSHDNTQLVKAALSALKENVHTENGSIEEIENLNNTAINIVRLRGKYWALDGAQLMLAREIGIINQIPNISLDAIAEKSGSDALVKFLAVLQTVWQIVKLLMRWASDEPSSQIEVVTVAYCVLTFFIYITYWSKPQEVSSPLVVSATRYATVEEIIKIARMGPAYMAGLFTGFEYEIPEHTLHTEFEDPHNKLAGGYWGWIGGVFGGVVFGLLHCAAWNFHFPTEIERLLWRVASIVTSAVPFVYGAPSIPFIQRLERSNRTRDVADLVMPTVGAVFGALYAFSRAFLLVETFRSLAFLTPGTFTN